IDVADEDVFALHADGFDDLIQKLPGASDEWPPLRVLICARRFADEHQTRLPVAFAVDDLRASLAAERTAHTLRADVLPDIFQSLARTRQTQFICWLDLAKQCVLWCGCLLDRRACVFACSHLCLLAYICGARGRSRRGRFRLRGRCDSGAGRGLNVSRAPRLRFGVAFERS